MKGGALLYDGRCSPNRIVTEIFSCTLLLFLFFVLLSSFSFCAHCSRCSLGDVHRFHSGGLPTHAVTVRVFLSFSLSPVLLSFNANYTQLLVLHFYFLSLLFFCLFLFFFFVTCFPPTRLTVGTHTRVQSMTKSLVFLFPSYSFIFLFFFSFLPFPVLFLAIVYPVIRYLYLLSPLVHSRCSHCMAAGRLLRDCMPWSCSSWM